MSDKKVLLHRGMSYGKSIEHIKQIVRWIVEQPGLKHLVITMETEEQSNEIQSLKDQLVKRDERIAKLKEALKRIHLEHEVNMCECGFQWKNSDAFKLSSDALKDVGE